MNWVKKLQIIKDFDTVIWGNSVTRDNYRHLALKISKNRQNSVLRDFAVEQKRKGHELFFQAWKS